MSVTSGIVCSGVVVKLAGHLLQLYPALPELCEHMNW
jgi:hypothetical protein